MAFVKEVKTIPQGITFGEWLNRYYLLDRITGLPGDKLAFARRKNLMILRRFEQENSQFARIPYTDGFTAYSRELQELREKHLLTDKDGKTLMQVLEGEPQPLVDVANPDYIQKLDALRLKHKAAIAERRDDENAYKEFMNQLADDSLGISIHRVKLSDAFGLNQQQVDAVYWFIEEE